jgi:hypothetical protein
MLFGYLRKYYDLLRMKLEKIAELSSNKQDIEALLK